MAALHLIRKVLCLSLPVLNDFVELLLHIGFSSVDYFMVGLHEKGLTLNVYFIELLRLRLSVSNDFTKTLGDSSIS